MLAGTWLDIILSIEVDFRWALAATNPWGPFISILRNVDVILSVPTPHGLTISHLTILPDPETTLSIQSLVKGSSLTTPGHDRCRSPSNRPHISLSWAGEVAPCVPNVILGRPYGNHLWSEFWNKRSLNLFASVNKFSFVTKKSSLRLKCATNSNGTEDKAHDITSSNHWELKTLALCCWMLKKLEYTNRT